MKIKFGKQKKNDNCDKEIIKKIIYLFKPFKWKVIAIIMSITISSILNVLTPIVNQKLMDEGLISNNIQVIIRCSIINLILIMLIQALGIIEVKYLSYIENILSFNLEKQAFVHTLKRKINFFLNNNHTEIMSNLKTDIRNISQVANQNTFYIVTSIFRIIVGIVGFLTINIKLALLVLLVTPIRYVIVKILAKKRKSLMQDYIESYKDYSSWYGDTIGGIKEVKLLNLYKLKINEFVSKQENIMNKNICMTYLGKANSISERLFTEVITTLIYVIGGYMIVGSELTVGKLFSFITYSSYVTEPIFAIMNLGYNFASIIPSAKRYFEFMSTETEVSNLEGDIKKLNEDKVIGSIEFKDVSFSYRNKEKLMNKINFKINAGEKVAIIGRNGSGKTTIINLILRLLKPDCGKILLDNMDIQYIDLEQYRNLISVVSQDVYLFNTTIKENIIINSNKTDCDMYMAINDSGANKFIEKLDNKYETIVGQRGDKLSGGEKQKIAMARAFIRESKVIILDEATANYDMEAEYYVNNVINKKSKDKTIILITHKPDILEKVDKVIVVNNGLIEDVGSPLELYERNEFYREMVKLPLASGV